MDCPGCRRPMTAETFDGRYGEHVEVDLCHGCGVLWFDGAESLILAPRAVLELLAEIHAHREIRTPPGGALPCPRCRGRLLRTSDVQRGTPFSYWRCPAEHGRLITFFDFLREKNFVRPLGPKELAELRRNVQTLTCSSCGAPLDVAHDSACRYCRAPIAVLDPHQLDRVVAELKQAESERKAAIAELPFRLAADRLQGDDASSGRPVTDSFGLVESGLAGVAALLKREA